MISEPMLIFVIAQTIAILGALVGMYVRLKGSLTEISTNLGHLETRRSEQKAAHDGLNKQVQGISRTVERHDALLEK